MVRGAVLLLSTALLFWSWRIAYADLLSHPTSGFIDAAKLDHAIALRPANVVYLLRRAEFEMEDFNTPDSKVRASLEEVLRLAPGNPAALMSLGLLEQRAGNQVLAEKYLLEAVAADHTLKPSWTLANFYFQTDQFSKMWPVIGQCLNIASPALPDLTRFDAGPMFELCRRAGATPRQIFDLTPQRPPLLMAYYFDAIAHKELAGALLSFPASVEFANPEDSLQRGAFSSLCWQLVEAGRTQDAVKVWNRLVAKRIVQSTPLGPEKGESIADPGFENALLPDAFGWVLQNPLPAHVGESSGHGWVEFTLDGHEEEQAELLLKNMPVLPKRTYSLRWTVEPVQIVKPSAAESGLTIRLSGPKGELPVTCPGLLESREKRECQFNVPAEMDLVRLDLKYERPLGAIRFEGTFRVSRFDLKLVN